MTTNSVQSTYNNTIAIGYAGQVPNGEPSTRISRTVETAAGIGFGQPAFRGTNDHGAVVGTTFAATGAGTAGATNVGTTTITASPAITAGAQQGRYTATQMVTSATGAVVVNAPDGAVVGHGVVGTAITTVPGVASFTLTAGGTATAGDQWFIDVTYTANVTFLGIVIADHGIQPLPGGAAADIVPQYASAALLNRGPIRVIAGATVTPGLDVYWNPASAKYTNTTTHLRMPGFVFDTSAVDTGIVTIVRR